MDWKSLGPQAAQAAMAFMAAKNAGPQALAMFLQGVEQSKQQAQQQKQAQTREDQRFAETQRMNTELVASREADDRRQESAARLDRLMKALQAQQQVTASVGETATDPVAAENQILSRSAGLESMFELPQGQLSASVPHMAPMISKGVQSDIADILDIAAAGHKNATNPDGSRIPFDDSTISWDWQSFSEKHPRVRAALLAAGHPEGQHVKLSDIQRLQGGLTITPPPLPATKLTPPTPGSFEDYLQAPPERRTEIEAARKSYNQSDDRPPAQRPADPVTVTIQTVDADGRPVTRVVPRSEAVGKDFPIAPGALERMSQNRFATAEPVLAAVDELSERINTQRGVVARITGAAAKAAAQANLNDDVAEYEALISGFTPLVARALGHSGVLTEQDVQSVRALFPQPGNSKSLRDRKIARIKQIIGKLTEQGGSAPSDPSAAEPIEIEGYTIRVK